MERLKFVYSHLFLTIAIALLTNTSIYYIVCVLKCLIRESDDKCTYIGMYILHICTYMFKYIVICVYMYVFFKCQRQEVLSIKATMAGSSTIIVNNLVDRPPE